MQIIPLSEGAFTIDRTKRFVPFDTGKDDLQERPVGSLLVEIQPFAIVTSEDILLIDTGLGFSVNGELQLYHNLRRAGIDPGRVTKVLMSHLHKDHAGGISGDSASIAGSAPGAGGASITGGSFSGGARSSVVASRELSFPNAQYYVQRKELDYAFEKGPTSYIPEELLCLKDSPRVTLLDGDGVIDGYIRYVVTGAHCPYHQVFWVVDGGETAFFGGDVAPQLQQMKSRFVAKYDYDGKRAMELRQEWWERGGEEGWTFLFYHDVNTPTLKRD
ncbi:MAG: MBL fold metallo-hydrolase [Bacteroidetes bacterium]|nr:MBL fold metallo-hydrolase [Bacteroidota bacterium]